MKFFFIFISLLSLFTSCTKTKNNNQLELFNNITFELKAGEQVVDIKPNINELYTELFNNHEPQVPLFKFIKHSNYKVFIGIPYNTSIDEMIKSQLQKPDSSLIFLKSGHNFIYNTYRNNEYYITEYSEVLKNKTIIYISSVSNEKSISDSLFNMLEISKRIKLKAE